jgi:hypothetical protein
VADVIICALLAVLLEMIANCLELEGQYILQWVIAMVAKVFLG